VDNLFSLAAKDVLDKIENGVFELKDEVNIFDKFFKVFFGKIFVKIFF
jgi:hypothetical protein